MYNFKLLFIFVVLFFSSIQIFAQERSISGRVLDQQTQNPLPGVNISIPQTDKGTVTDEDGYFELAISPDIDLIEVSYVGYKKQQISVKKGDEQLEIFLKPDNVTLGKVQVVGFDTKELQETDASVALLTSEEFERTSQVSLQPVLNTIPGVQMDQSNLSDARISIRGSGVRSNFGNRNIKMYINEIPLTEADGFTRIEGLDVSTVGRADIIKGPASSIYGAGTGGVINFQMEKAEYGQNSIEVNGLAGSYGLTRLATKYQGGSNQFNTSVTVGSQTYDGYREHSKDERRFFTGSLQFFPSKNQNLTLLLNRSGQKTHLPGNINADQVQENPRQANESNLEQQAGRFQNWTRLGAAHTYQFSDRFKNTTSVYTSFYDMEHPLAFAYLRQPYQSYGGRTRFEYNFDAIPLPTKITFGGEYQNGFTAARRFENNGGTEGELILNQELDNMQYSLFLQSETSLTDQTTFTAGLSLNKVHYNINDLMDQAASGMKNFDPQWMPRVAVSHIFNDKLMLRSGISFGFSPPTTSEITGADGRIRNQVQAEKGVNYEVGARGTLANVFNYDITLFSFQMEDQLIPQTVGQNNTIYNNAGETSKQGLEVALSYGWSSESSVISSFKAFANYAYSNFTFKDFRLLDAGDNVIANYSGNEVTGIAPHQLSAGLDLTTKPGFYFNATWFFKDEAPLTDENSVYNKSYSVVDTKAGFKTTLGNHFKMDLNVGINNLLDESYTSRTALNATSFDGSPPPFFDPAPPRNFYSGLSVSYIF